MAVIGLDTSNYTTSIAYIHGDEAVNCSKLLPVKQGELGLRQSDAVFAHIKSLPELSGRLFSDISRETVRAIGVSTRPIAKPDITPENTGEKICVLTAHLQRKFY